MRVLAETYDFDLRAYLLLDQCDVPIGGIPYCHIADMLGERLVALPFSDYCDPLIVNDDDWQCLAGYLLSYNQPIALRCLHAAQPGADQRFTLTKQAYWHGMDLKPDIDTLWSGLRSTARWGIKKARRSGVTVRAADSVEDLRFFFNLHCKVRRYKYGMLAQPYHFFEQIWRHFIAEQNGVLLLASYQERVIGSVMFLRWQDTLYYKFSASDQEYLAYEPNDLMLWEGINYAKACGCHYLDFGLSDWDQKGLVNYKRKFATEEKTISFFRYAPSDALSQELRQEQQARKLLTQLTRLLVDPAVPDTITATAGDLLYRFFS